MKAVENHIFMDEEAIAELQISNLSLHSKSIINERVCVIRLFVSYLVHKLRWVLV